jgi:HEPN domain-containing protein
MSAGCEEWFRQADYDLDSASAMLRADRCPHAVFFCHLAAEKALKGIYAAVCGAVPPRTHNLPFLAGQAGLDVSEARGEFLFVLSRVSVLARYPEDIESLLSEFPRERTEAILEQTTEMLKWLRSQLPTL